MKATSFLLSKTSTHKLEFRLRLVYVSLNSFTPFFRTKLSGTYIDLNNLS